MLNPDFHDILSTFIEHRVEFLVVGGYAMAAHQLPRATKDLDLWVRPSAENARRVLDALDRFGAGHRGGTIRFSSSVQCCTTMNPSSEARATVPVGVVNPKTSACSDGSGLIIRKRFPSAEMS